MNTTSASGKEETKQEGGNAEEESFEQLMQRIHRAVGVIESVKHDLQEQMTTCAS